MKYIILFSFILFFIQGFSQTINLNENHIENYLRNQQLFEKTDYLNTFTIRPISNKKNQFNYFKIISNSSSKIRISLLPVDYITSYNSKVPYNYNNGSMIPSKGLQQIFSPGIHFNFGLISIQLKPEYVFSENKFFNGFSENHYDVIWERRYNAWNKYDIPERFGDESFKKTYLGQSSLKLNFKNFSIGFSSENLWWGPSIRNSIMMSNNAKGFNHFTFNSNKPLKTSIGNFEWQFITGKLDPSRFTPPQPDKKYQKTKLYVPKTDNTGIENPSRFFQGYVLSFSPKWIKGLTIGHIKWVQTYNSFFDVKLKNVSGLNYYFPVFDSKINYNGYRDGANGFFFRSLWVDSNAEIYGEFYKKESNQDFQDSPIAHTLGLQKLFKQKKKNNYLKFSWEWTKLEQESPNLIDNLVSFYSHDKIRHGFTNRGEVIGSWIGPGSNSQFFKISSLYNKRDISFALEIIDNDNDWYYYAYSDNKDYRRYWKSYNVHFEYINKFKNFWISAKLVHSSNLNYQWELDNELELEEWYRPGVDVNNFHSTINLSYHF